MGRRSTFRSGGWPISAYMLGLVALFAATAFGGIEYAKVRSEATARRQMSVSTQFAARQAAAGTSASVSAISKAVAALAGTPGLAGATGPSCHLGFDGAAPFVSGQFDLVAADGSVTCSSSAAAMRYSYKGAAWLGAPQHRPKLYGPVRDRSDGQLALVDAEGVPGFGVAAAVLDLGRIATDMSSLYGGAQHFDFRVTDRAGALSVSRPVHADGTKMLYSHDAIAPLGWVVWAGVPQSMVVSNANSVFGEQLIIILAGLVVILLAAWVGDSLVGGPVRQLARAVRLRASGEPGSDDAFVNLPVKGPAEVQTLTRGFKELLGAVDDELAQRRQAEAAARAAEESYRALFYSNPVPMWVYDRQTWRFLAVNQAAVDGYGYSREEFLSMSIRRIQVPDNLPWLERSLARSAPMRRSGPWHHVSKNGDLIEVEVAAHDVAFEGRPARFVMAENVGERQAYERQLRDFALHDQLTGLANRTMLSDRIEQAMARLRPGQMVAVLVCNLDRFKDIINFHGQTAADQLLIEMAGRLVRAAGPCETVGRMGADEFALVCESMSDETEAVAVADRLNDELAQPFHIGGSDVFVSASTGIVTTLSGRSADEVVRDAIYAMHRAKEVGGGTYEIFDESVRERAIAKIHLATGLRGAVDRGELRLYYQPEIDLVTGSCTGAEALMRWQHPTDGLLPPALFIPLAEETGAILELGNWAIDEACRQGAEWARDKSGPPQVSVNLSARQLAMPNLVRHVARALTTSGLEPSGMCLEITETALMSDADSAMETLLALHELGVHLSIDDFGTGYSSLLYLRRYPVHYLKIDRAFVSGLGTTKHDHAIAAGIIELGHAFSLKVVAEGVETGGQLSMLRRMECDLAQGYLWSQAIPSEQLVGLLDSTAPGHIRL